MVSLIDDEGYLLKDIYCFTEWKKEKAFTFRLTKTDDESHDEEDDSLSLSETKNSNKMDETHQSIISSIYATSCPHPSIFIKQYPIETSSNTIIANKGMNYKCLVYYSLKKGTFIGHHFIILTEPTDIHTDYIQAKIKKNPQKFDSNLYYLPELSELPWERSDVIQLYRSRITTVPNLPISQCCQIPKRLWKSVFEFINDVLFRDCEIDHFFKTWKIYSNITQIHPTKTIESILDLFMYYRYTIPYEENDGQIDILIHALFTFSDY